MDYRNDYIKALGLNLDGVQLSQLEGLLNCVWEKKDVLNLTSVKDKQEILDRHILDGLTAAPLVKCNTLADCGAGAGYIGLSLKIALPDVHITLIESLERRCAFMEWVIYKLGLKNIKVLNARLGFGDLGKFDFVTERAMGKIDDVLPLCAGILAKGGRFAAYQAAGSNYNPETLKKCLMEEEASYPYILPAEEKERKLVVFKWI